MPALPVVVRHVLEPAECRSLLGAGVLHILVLRIGPRLAAGIELLEWVQMRAPLVRLAVVLDEPDADIEGLAWDLGASAVLSASQHRDLPAIIASLAHSLVDGRKS
jgi:hypothetical protein